MSRHHPDMQTDDTLAHFARHGTPPLPSGTTTGHVDHDGARICYADIGSGSPVILLHGGLGHGGNWRYQLPALLAGGYRAILIDSRGHGRSTRDARPYGYELLANDVLAVMDELAIARAALVGWSDGACTAMILAAGHAERANGVFFFGCNMDPSGTLPFVPSPVIDNCFARHRQDYASLSTAPDEFDAFVEAVSLMQRTQPNYTAAELARIAVPVCIVHSEGDEFIRPEHARYLAETIPGAELVILPGVSHFAPLQRPDEFNTALVERLTLWNSR
jgi:pimeloyl-ACP methyl ester carboxylesterase